jgi:beta-galactosidase
VLAVSTVETAGQAVALRLWVEGGYRARNESVIEGLGDVALLGVSVVDGQGRVVPVGAHNVSFSVAGPAEVVGVHNGAPADHSSAKASWRNTYHGLARVIVGGKGGVGVVTVTASAEGLQESSVQIEAK